MILYLINLNNKNSILLRVHSIEINNLDRFNIKRRLKLSWNNLSNNIIDIYLIDFGLNTLV